MSYIHDMRYNATKRKKNTVYRLLVYFFIFAMITYPADIVLTFSKSKQIYETVQRRQLNFVCNVK